MANGRAVDREDPCKSRRNEARHLDRDPMCELHQGPRSDEPHREAGHMTAPDHFAEAHSKRFEGGASTYELWTLAPPSYASNPIGAAAVRSGVSAPAPP